MAQRYERVGRVTAEAVQWTGTSQSAAAILELTDHGAIVFVPDTTHPELSKLDLIWKHYGETQRTVTPLGHYVLRFNEHHIMQMPAADFESCYLPIGTHLPRRGDDVEKWLKAKRDTYAHRRFEPSQAMIYDALDGLLDDYRLHCDTGTPLLEHACEGPGCEHTHTEPTDRSDVQAFVVKDAALALTRAVNLLTVVTNHNADLRPPIPNVPLDTFDITAEVLRSMRAALGDLNLLAGNDGTWPGDPTASEVLIVDDPEDELTGAAARERNAKMLEAIRAAKLPEAPNA